MGAARFTCTVILIELTNQLGGFTRQRDNSGICNVILLKYMLGGYASTQLQQATVGKIRFFIILPQ